MAACIKKDTAKFIFEGEQVPTRSNKDYFFGNTWVLCQINGVARHEEIGISYDELYLGGLYAAE